MTIRGRFDSITAFIAYVNTANTFSEINTFSSGLKLGTNGFLKELSSRLELRNFADSSYIGIRGGNGDFATIRDQTGNQQLGLSANRMVLGRATGWGQIDTNTLTALVINNRAGDVERFRLDDTKLDLSGIDFSIDPTQKIYLNTNTFITEASAGNVEVTVSGVKKFNIQSNAIGVPTNTRIIFDQFVTGHTYMVESANDQLDTYVGGTLVSRQTLSAVNFMLPVGNKVYTDATRPSASSLQAGSQIWNSDDNAPNWSDGTNWRDAMGTVT